MLSALSFPSIEEKREYVRTTLIKRGRWNPTLESEVALSDVSQDVREDAETPAILQPSMPQKSMGNRQKKYDHLPDLPNPIRPKKAAASLLQRKVPLGRMAKSKSGKPDPKSIKDAPDRSCRYCKAKFKPIREDQRFCKPAHRKSFWKYGGLPFDKMKEQIMKDVRKMVSAEITKAIQDHELWSNSAANRANR
jgi:hypothetical protein